MPDMNRICDNCGRDVPASEQMYSMRLELFARVEPLVFSAEDLAKDTLQEIEKLAESMNNMDPDEAMDQVHESYIFDVCSLCRRRFHEQLRSMKGKKE